MSTGILDMSKGTNINPKLRELDTVILSLTSQLLSIQKDQSALLRIKDDIEKELLDLKEWNVEKSRYELKKLETGVFVYSPKQNIASSVPDHWLCANCYNDNKKSILQPMNVRMVDACHFCPTCKTKYETIE